MCVVCVCSERVCVCLWTCKRSWNECKYVCVCVIRGWEELKRMLNVCIVSVHVYSECVCGHVVCVRGV